MGVLATLVAGACSPAQGEGPTLDPIPDQVVHVGEPLRLALRASDPDHDVLSYELISSIPDFDTRAQVRPFGDGALAELVWTPLASDVGDWAVDVTVSDGPHESTETVILKVRAPGAGAPVFRAPLGSGTTFDLGASACLDLEVVVEDADSAGATLSQREPLVEGATLEIGGRFSGRWHWCPSAAQVAAADRYPLTLAAVDDAGEEALLHYLIVLRHGCADDAGEPDDAPADATLVDLDAGRFAPGERAICAADADWYAVTLYAGETLHATLAFAQTSAAEDLDLQLYREAVRVADAASSDANETLVTTVAETGLYYLVVRGWQDAAAPYQLCLGLAEADCPGLP